MGLSFADLVERKRTFLVKFANGATLEVTYRPDNLTPATLARLGEAGSGDDDELTLARMAAEILTDWELEGPFAVGTDCEVKAGEKVPITPEHLAYLPGPHMGHIINSITEDANPDPKRKGRSSGRS